MILNEIDSTRLDTFTKAALGFLKERSENIYYKNNTGVNLKTITLKDGTIVPFDPEYVLVLDNEFESLMAQHAHQLLLTLSENVESNLFSFAERPVLEFITKWLFAAIDESIPLKSKNRIKTLLFAGHYKFVDTSDRTAFGKYIRERGDYLKEADKQKLVTLNTMDTYFDYVWEVVKGITNEQSEKSTSFLSSIWSKAGVKSIFSRQSMLVHGNPFMILETLGNTNKTARRRLLVAFYLRQIIEYYRHSHFKEFEKLRYLFDKFWKNNKIQLD